MGLVSAALASSASLTCAVLATDLGKRSCVTPHTKLNEMACQTNSNRATFCKCLRNHSPDSDESILQIHSRVSFVIQHLQCICNMWSRPSNYFSSLLLVFDAVLRCFFHKCSANEIQHCNAQRRTYPIKGEDVVVAPGVGQVRVFDATICHSLLSCVEFTRS